MNHKAIDAGATAYKKFDVPADWADAKDEPVTTELTGSRERCEAGREHHVPRGPHGRRQPACFRLRAIMWTASSSRALPLMRSAASPSAVPTWDATKCIQCNNCAYVCPHATIRPFALTEEEAAERSRRCQDRGRQGRQGQGRLQVHHGRVSAGLHGLRRAASGVCPDGCPDHGCPGSRKLHSRMCSTTAWPRSLREDRAMQDNTVKGSQFKQPYLEFSGSCAGCAETSLCPSRHPALRRPDVHLQRHRLLLHLGRSRRHLSLLHRQERPRSRLGQLPVRGQRRARPGHVPGPGGHPQPSG